MTPGCAGRHRNSGRSAIREYYDSVNVVKASEDKTFPGAIAAGLASPWGQSVPAGNLTNGEPTYFGSYREVFARDLYEAFTGLLVAGDIQTARDATSVPVRPPAAGRRLDAAQLADQRQAGARHRWTPARRDLLSDPDGLAVGAGRRPQPVRAPRGSRRRLPRRPRSQRRGRALGGAVRRLALDDRRRDRRPDRRVAYRRGQRRSAPGPALPGRGRRVRPHGQGADRDRQRPVHQPRRAQLLHPRRPERQPRLVRQRRQPRQRQPERRRPALGDRRRLPGAGATRRPVGERSHGQVVADGRRQRSSSARRPAASASIATASTPPSRSTATATATSPSGSSCTTPGAPWPPTDTGTGHLWPVLSGERGEYDLAAGDPSSARSLLQSMQNMQSGQGLEPEQAWEDPNLAASPYGTDPTTASIGFTDGGPAGSASPLTWAQAQYARLAIDLSAGRDLETPQIVTDRYVTHGMPGSLPVTITSPDPGRERDEHDGDRHRNDRARRHGRRRGGRVRGRRGRDRTPPPPTRRGTGRCRLPPVSATR